MNMLSEGRGHDDPRVNVSQNALAVPEYNRTWSIPVLSELSSRQMDFVPYRRARIESAVSLYFAESLFPRIIELLNLEYAGLSSALDLIIWSRTVCFRNSHPFNTQTT